MKNNIKVLFGSILLLPQIVTYLVCTISGGGVKSRKI